MTSVISFVWTGPLPSNEEVIELSAKLEAAGGGMPEYSWHIGTRYLTDICAPYIYYIYLYINSILYECINSPL